MAVGAELNLTLSLKPADVILYQKDSWTIVRLACCPEGTVIQCADSG